MHRLRSTCGVLLLAVLVSPVFAGNYRWTVQGPYGGQAHHVIHDATDPSIVYAATSNGFFRSVDGGRTWRATLRNIFVDDLAYASGASKLFATTFDDLYVSSDRGQTWANRVAVLRFVQDKVEDLEMPPLNKRVRFPALSAAEVMKLRGWIAQGAAWPEGTTLQFKEK